MTQFTANEVRACKKVLASVSGTGTAQEMLNAFADLLETREKAVPVAWRTFDGEGNYDYRDYENNEHYRDRYVSRNGAKYANWVEPLYSHPAPSDAERLAEALRAQYEIVAADYERYIDGSPKVDFQTFRIGLVGLFECIEELIAAHSAQAQQDDDELPGMWSHSDFVGGDPDVRSYAERQAQPPAGEVHSCSFYCDRPECVKQQRDELVRRYVEGTALAQPPAARVTDAAVPVFSWQPIETAPKDNKHPLFLARFNDDGSLQSFDYDAIWMSESESWEIPEVYFLWASANGNVEEPTHWAYQPAGFGKIEAALAAQENPMDFNRMWTDFALAAEYERFGMTRIAAAHNSAIKQREQDKEDAVHSGIAMALGWMYQEACRTADAGLDIRTARVPDLLERALRDLAPEDSGNG